MAEAAIAGTLTGCVGCMLQIEALSKASPGCMNLMTFSTFLFVSFVGLVQQSKFFTVMPRNKIPLTRYIHIIILFFLINVGNNLSLSFGVSVPLFIIFRSGTLIANLILGRLLKNKIYSYGKILSVIFVSIGIITFTLADKRQGWLELTNGQSTQITTVPRTLLGVALLTSALFTSSYLGLCQEDLYRYYGKYPKETMFFAHALSLPGFLLLRADISATVARFNASDYLVDSLPIPRLWLLLLSVCILQWLCISYVYNLTSLTSSLNVTMVVTLRKFISLTLSIIVFKNPFNRYHFLGGLLVLVGTLGFTEVWKTKTWRNWKRKND